MSGEDTEASFRAMVYDIAPEVASADPTAAAWFVDGHEPTPAAVGVLETVAEGAKPHPMRPYMSLLHTASGDSLAEFMPGQESAEQAPADVKSPYDAAATEAGFLNSRPPGRPPQRRPLPDPDPESGPVPTDEDAGPPSTEPTAMPHRTFFRTILPSLLAMVLFIFVPILSVAYQPLFIEHEQLLSVVETAGPFGITTSTRIDTDAMAILNAEAPIGRFDGLGTDVNSTHLKDRDISMAFRSDGLYPNLSVYENIRIPLRVRKVRKEHHQDMVMKAIEMTEFGDFMDRRPADLSGGQRQRVVSGRAIVRKPTVFLMDEPLSNLDAKPRVSTRAQIKNLQSRLKTTTVYVTHDQIETMTLADRVVVMNKDRIQQVGSPTDFYDMPANTFVASFIGSHAKNLVEGTLRDGTFEGHGIRVEGLPAGPSGAVTLGFRAEDAALVASGGRSPRRCIRSSCWGRRR